MVGSPWTPLVGLHAMPLMIFDVGTYSGICPVGSIQNWTSQGPSMRMFISTSLYLPLPRFCSDLGFEPCPCTLMYAHCQVRRAFGAGCIVAASSSWIVQVL